MKNHVQIVWIIIKRYLREECLRSSSTGPIEDVVVLKTSNPYLTGLPKKKKIQNIYITIDLGLILMAV